MDHITTIVFVPSWYFTSFERSKLYKKYKKTCTVILSGSLRDLLMFVKVLKKRKIVIDIFSPAYYYENCLRELGGIAGMLIYTKNIS